MTAEQIMRNSVMWDMWHIAAHDCYWAIYCATDNANWLESGVLDEGTLRAQDIMREVTK